MQRRGSLSSVRSRSAPRTSYRTLPVPEVVPYCAHLSPQGSVPSPPPPSCASPTEPALPLANTITSNPPTVRARYSPSRYCSPPRSPTRTVPVLAPSANVWTDTPLTRSKSGQFVVAEDACSTSRISGRTAAPLVVPTANLFVRTRSRTPPVRGRAETKRPVWRPSKSLDVKLTETPYVSGPHWTGWDVPEGRARLALSVGRRK
eukprot:TRINITY_DN21034_c0_g1_i1.p1 TRINITY_DN21034_c0_g1~~TRINITY_DN21034_c0_g1_i1.p1  ORF type:complete len:204 (+),score=4.29 TRINITY_DN21034_c0_g1_i1:34-645(+)